jgi:hypothetical protein
LEYCGIQFRHFQRAQAGEVASKSSRLGRHIEQLRTGETRAHTPTKPREE